MILRYEAIVRSDTSLQFILRFCGSAPQPQEANQMHGDSLAKWKRDHLFGFTLSDEVIDLAKRFDYEEDELHNQSYFTWPIYHNTLCGTHFVMRCVARGFRFW